jgi:hypothetical protein
MDLGDPSNCEHGHDGITPTCHLEFQSMCTRCHRLRGRPRVRPRKTIETEPIPSGLHVFTMPSKKRASRRDCAALHLTLNQFLNAGTEENQRTACGAEARTSIFVNQWHIGEIVPALASSRKRLRSASPSPTVQRALRGEVCRNSALVFQCGRLIISISIIADVPVNEASPEGQFGEDDQITSQCC